MNPNYQPYKQPKSVAQLKKQLWKQFSIYIRTREADEEGYTRCFTCGVRKHYKEMDAGHYIAKNIGGSNLYFDEHNVHVQCDRCNRILSSNGAAYALALVHRYGNGILDRLEAKKKDSRPYSHGELMILINHYKKLNETREHNRTQIAK